MNHGFAKGRSLRANLASESWKHVKLLFVVKLLLWESVNEEKLCEASREVSSIGMALCGVEGMW